MKLDYRIIVPALVFTACAWWQKNGALVVSDLTDAGLCEIQYIEATPAPTPQGAVAACVGLVLTDAEKTFAALSIQVDATGSPTPIALKLKSVRK
jgi:hypothetical protein